MGYRLVLRFDYLSLFVPYKDAVTGNGVAVLIPDLHLNPLPARFKVGAHHAICRWRQNQQGMTAPNNPAGLSSRKVHQRTPGAETPKLEVSKLEMEDIEIHINGKPLTGPPPGLKHLNELTSLEEFGLGPDFTHIYNGYLDNKPTANTTKVTKEAERMNLAARIRLKGGEFFIDKPLGLSLHDFFLTRNPDAPPSSTAKRIAREVRWQSDVLQESDRVDILFKPFGMPFNQYLHLRPENPTQTVVELLIRNCDSEGDFLLPGLPGYAAINNYEPQVYQTLAVGYTGFDSITEIIHRPNPLSANGVCGPAQAQGTGG